VRFRNLSDGAAFGTVDGKVHLVTHDDVVLIGRQRIQTSLNTLLQHGFRCCAKPAFIFFRQGISVSRVWANKCHQAPG